ncbi:MAG: IS110 family transposase [Saprospiraceae bacterium]
MFNYVKKNYPGYEISIAYEVGCCGYKPARDFISFGWDTYVVNPADIPRPSKSKFMKTDKIDAKNIARQLRSGNLKKITIPGLERESLRSLTRQRTALVRDYRRIKTRIKSLLLYLQIEIPEGMDTPKWPIKFIKWLEDLELGYTNSNFTLESMLNQYQFIDIELKRLSTQIRKHCKENHKKDYMLLRSVPGIAGLTAGYILAEIGDIRRFSSLKKFASYIGFIPSMHQSGEGMYTGGSTPRANRHVRNMIIEAAWIAIRTDPVMQNYYRSHAGKNSKAVIFKVGRKQLSKIMAVIKSEIPYSVGVLN